jgi:hypothetical protein
MDATAEPREIRKFQIRRGDVLATKDSESPEDIAISALVDDDLPGVLCGYHLAMMRPCSNSLFGPFLAWTHASKQFRTQYEARAVGVTRFGLPQYVFRAARLPLPPRPEQERIAAYLDASCAAIDAAVSAKRRQIATPNLVRASIIEKAVTQGLGVHARQTKIDQDWIGSLPERWSVTRIKRLVSRLDYGISVRTEPEEGMPSSRWGIFKPARSSSRRWSLSKRLPTTCCLPTTICFTIERTAQIRSERQRYFVATRTTGSRLPHIWFAYGSITESCPSS